MQHLGPNPLTRHGRTFAAPAILLCAGLLAVAQAPAPPPPAGAPLPGLSAADLDKFEHGKEDFLEVETEEDGLGPTFNGTSCGACHNQPAVGGFGNTAVMRAGRRNADGSFTAPNGFSLIHLFSLPEHDCQPVIPRDANVFTRRIPTPVFGGGLIEGIPDDAIRAIATANAAHPDRIGGRVAEVTDLATQARRVGRFGWKAQHATLLAFGADAYLGEMGITSDLFPDEAAALPAQRLSGCDKVPGIEDKRDPATGLRGIDNFENFMKFLAPPPSAPRNAIAARGSQVFADAGCAACHVPFQTTGRSATPALDRRPVVLYSDLLLHDVGTGDGIPQGDAGPNEFRTAPLWGMRMRKMLLHDGRALNPAQAIDMHGREASRAVGRWRDLSADDRAALLAFLDTL